MFLLSFKGDQKQCFHVFENMRKNTFFVAILVGRAKAFLLQVSKYERIEGISCVG